MNAMKTPLKRREMKDAIRTTIESPLGALTLTSAGGFLTGMTMEGQKHVATALPAGTGQPAALGCVGDDPRFSEVRDQLHAYFAGTPDPLRHSGQADRK